MDFLECDIYSVVASYGGGEECPLGVLGKAVKEVGTECLGTLHTWETGRYQYDLESLCQTHILPSPNLPAMQIQSFHFQNLTR